MIRAEEQPRGRGRLAPGLLRRRRGRAPSRRWRSRPGRAATTCSGTPVGVAGRCTTSSTRVRPDAVIVDHLAFSARLGLVSARHPPRRRRARAPVGAHRGRRGLRLPAGLAPAASGPDPDALAELRRCATTSATTFTAQWNAALADARPGGAAQRRRLRRDRRRAAAQLPRRAARPRAHGAAARPHLPRLGGARGGPATPRSRRGSPLTTRPVVYVSLGSFLSVRADVLAVGGRGTAAARRAGGPRHRVRAP